MSSKVSIMMPVYNGESSVRFALCSVLAQTHEDWECIVVDDGSVDRTPDILARFRDPRIVVVTLPENRGRGVARQIALDAASGSCLAFLDADDWMYPRKLERQLQVLQTYPSAAAITGKYAVIDDRVELMGMSWGLAEPADGPVLRRFDSLCRPPLNYAVTLMRMDVAKAFAYDPSLRRAQDLDFMLKALRGRDFVVDDVAGFAYSGWRVNSARSRRAARFERMIFRSYLRSEPVAAARLWLMSAAKSGVVTLPNVVARPIVERRHRLLRPSEAEAGEFARALDTVLSIDSETAEAGVR